MHATNLYEPAACAPQAALQPANTAWRDALRCVRGHGLRFLLTSLALLIPCFWHRWIVAGDLGSHLYNAWLAQLIEQGKLSGLLIHHQWSNVLFDYLLSGLASAFGFWAAEKIAVSLAVLIFFWGAFAFVAVAGRCAPWFLAPLIAMAAYGWVFNMGFFNFYISIGLSFWGLAFLIAAQGRKTLWALAFVPLVVLAHPIGMAWYAGAAVYVLAARALSRRYQPALLLGAAAALWGAHVGIVRVFAVRFAPSPYRFTGADQFALFGVRYWLLAAVVLLTAFLVVAADLRTANARDLARYALPLQLYAAALLGVFLIPRAIYMNGVGSIGFLTERISFIALILGCAVLAAARPRRWHFAGFAAIAAAFFLMLYTDTARIARMQAAALQLVSVLPPGQRVISSIWPAQHSRVQIRHIVDLACVGRCFSYGDYEPSSGEFRIRAYARNPYVLSDTKRINDLEEGRYVVAATDLPVYEIYQCTSRWTDLCIRAMHASESSGGKTAASAINRSW